MRSATILVAVALIAAVTPTTATPDDCDNEAFFERLLTTRPAGYADGVDEDWSSVPLSADAQILVSALAARVAPACMEDVMAASHDGGGFPVVSDDAMLMEFTLSYNPPWCNRVPEDFPLFAGGGPGGHYDEAEELPPQVPAVAPWDTGGPVYAGVATSVFSVTPAAYYRQAVFHDFATGESFPYAQEIIYAGHSDFWCYAYKNPFGFHEYVTVNFPFLSGYVGPRVVPPVPCLPSVQLGKHQIGGCPPL